MNYVKLNQAKALIALANIQILGITFLIVALCTLAGNFMSFSGSIVSITHEFSIYERIFFLKSIRTFEAWHDVIAVTAITYALVTWGLSKVLVRYGKLKTAVVVSYSLLVGMAMFDISIKAGQKLWELENGARYNDVSSITEIIQNLNLTTSLRDSEKVGPVDVNSIEQVLKTKSKEAVDQTDKDYDYMAEGIHELIWLNAFLIFINGGAVALFLWRTRNTKIHVFRPVPH